MKPVIRARIIGSSANFWVEANRRYLITNCTSPTADVSVATVSRMACELRARHTVVTKVAGSSAMANSRVLRMAQPKAGSGERKSEAKVMPMNAHIGMKNDGRFGLRGCQTIQ